MKVSDLITYIVWYATQRGMKLTTTRVVKFVYLADLFYARANGGAMFTGCPWRFIHYGPYCSEVMTELQSAVKTNQIFEDRRESKFGDKDYFLYTSSDNEAENIENEIPTSILSPLRLSIKLFGDDTQALLDCVYFETEPMEDVRKGDLLDFNKARPLEKSKLVVFAKPSKKQIEEGKRCIERLAQKMKKGQKNLEDDNRASSEFYDEVYFRALESIEEEDLRSGLTGTARILIE